MCKHEPLFAKVLCDIVHPFFEHYPQTSVTCLDVAAQHPPSSITILRTRWRLAAARLINDWQRRLQTNLTRDTAPSSALGRVHHQQQRYAVCLALLISYTGLQKTK